MSLLAPFFVLGGLAIGLPIIFHLVRREPKNKLPFSSLLFLDPSPARISRRSRLDQWLLLLLRALVLLFIAAAFARPFLRSSDAITAVANPNYTVFLVDRSASMKCGDLWEQAIQRVQAQSDALSAGDKVSLVVYDSQPMTLQGFGEGEQQIPSDLADKLAKTKPTWFGSNLGDALVFASELIEESIRSDNDDGGKRTIVAISDFQSGSQLGRLQNYQWPSVTTVRWEQLALPPSTNATVYAMQDRDADDAFGSNASATERGGVPLRVTNAANSTSSVFRLKWKDVAGKDIGESLQVTVPPGASKVVRAPHPPTDATAIELTGDDHSFDNMSFTIVPKAKEQKILFIGQDTADPRESLLYYLQRVNLDSPQRTVAVEVVEPTDSESPFGEYVPVAKDVPLVVLHSIPPANARVAYQDYVRSGGHILMVLDSEMVENVATVPMVRELVGDPLFDLKKNESKDYVLLTRIDFTSSLFNAFADTRFSDFSKIQFWKHGTMVTDEQAGWLSLASFDDRQPALLRKPFEKGDWFLMAAGWQPTESQLALSTKFVPIIAGMLGGNAPGDQVATRELGQPLAWDPSDSAILIKPNGDEVRFPQGENKTDQAQEWSGQDIERIVDTPGIYHWHQEGKSDRQSFAVNLPSSESQIDPLDPTVLEQWGVRFTDDQKEARQVTSDRMKRDVEIEQSQQWWKILLLAALGIIGLETYISGRRKSSAITPKI
jgi:hypothetical protein